MWQTRFSVEVRACALYGARQEFIVPAPHIPFYLNVWIMRLEPRRRG